MLELLEYLVLGIGVGTVGALLGLGGGFILVPIFMLFMIAPHGSTFTTLAPGALSPVLLLPSIRSLPWFGKTPCPPSHNSALPPGAIHEALPQ